MMVLHYCWNISTEPIDIVYFQIAHEHGIPFLETSAKSNINVEKAFMDLAQGILNKVCNCIPCVNVLAQQSFLFFW